MELVLTVEVQDGHTVDLPRKLDDFEREVVVQALILANGVKSNAAKLVGIHRTTLVEKMRRWGMPLSH